MPIGLEEREDCLVLTGFGRPFGLYRDRSDRLLVTDMDLHGIFRFSADFTHVEWLGDDNTEWQALGAVQRGHAVPRRRARAPRRFNGPHSVCEAPGDRLIALTYYTPALHVLAEAGAQVEEIGAGLLTGPATITRDNSGRLLVTEYGGHGVLAFSSERADFGRFLGGLGGGQEGFRPRHLFTASSAQACFDRPHMCRQLNDGDLLIADTWNHRLQRFSVDGAWRSWLGEAGKGGAVSSAPGFFHGPVALAVGEEGCILVTDWGNDRLQWFSPKGDFLRFEIGPGLNRPYDALVAAGRVIVADSHNGRVLSWKAA